MLDPYLQRCLDLARKGGSSAAPNPMVGSVIVADGQIIGEGWHQKYGEAHAEVQAVRSVSNPDLLTKATLYVSLEPCSFFGKTPPCSHLIVEHKIPKVVVGVLDPNPKVAGSGIAYLRQHGVEVSISETPGPFIELNKRFWINQAEQRPWIVLKWAMSRDGFIAALDEKGDAVRTSISSAQNFRFVHKLRAENQALLVGTRTAKIDNPSLTTRLVPGPDPVRIVFDRDCSLPPDLNLFAESGKVIVLNEKQEESIGNRHYLKFGSQLSNTLNRLYRLHRIGSIMVEGGSQTLQKFIEEGLYDEIFITQGRQKFQQGIPAPYLPKHLNFVEYEHPQERIYHWRRKFEGE